MTRYNMVIDLERCVGCRACMEACKIENNTPEGAFWMYVFRLEEGEYPETKSTFMPRPCQHCDNAPCVKVCPVGARYKRDDGIVSTDWDRCIGCRYCEVACPYGVNYFNYEKPGKRQYLDWENGAGRSETNGENPPYKNPDHSQRYGKERRHIAGSNHSKGVMDKCTFCVQRVERSLDPACVEACPVFALHFGDADDPDSNISRLLRTRKSFKLLEDWNTKPSVSYLGTAPSPKAREIEKPKARA
ncbi:MAG: 4Fe-4S dicluster domain-containing protein [SAR202 cluster bacterium]|nr:4Fe-4S dicluster domain-containing protein [SAR202 cluster bacterium]